MISRSTPCFPGCCPTTSPTPSISTTRGCSATYRSPWGRSTRSGWSSSRSDTLSWRRTGRARPRAHYGAHYSSAGIVLFYLLRLEPFTALGRQLQGGLFDHADRLFSSVAETWRACLTSTADVKELIPECGQPPEFLETQPLFHLGTRQDGVAVGDVELPPWAKGSTHEFVRVMREALESETVSARIHEWIDLVFGAAHTARRRFGAKRVSPSHVRGFRKPRRRRRPRATRARRRRRSSTSDKHRRSSSKKHTRAARHRSRLCLRSDTRPTPSRSRPSPARRRRRPSRFYRWRRKASAVPPPPPVAPRRVSSS